MIKFFKKGQFYPQNFILTDCESSYAEDFAKEICEEARAISPDSFNSENPYFMFQLRYCEPYEYREFRELKRLQEEAIANVRFQDEYRGYIVADLTEWAGHTDEELFSSVVLNFLRDMSDCWKYILFFGKDSEADVKNIRKTLWSVCVSHSKITPVSCAGFMANMFSRKYNITMSSEVFEILGAAVEYPRNMNREKLETLVYDMSLFFGSPAYVDENGIKNYLTDEETFFCSLITESERERMINEIIEKER